jgi:hypothetical protein
MFGMLSVLAELQRELIVANTRDGLAAARARGRRGGRPPKLTLDQAALAQRLYDAGEHTVAQIAAILTVPRSTIYGHLNKATVGTRPRAQKTVVKPSPPAAEPAAGAGAAGDGRTPAPRQPECPGPVRTAGMTPRRGKKAPRSAPIWPSPGSTPIPTGLVRFSPAGIAAAANPTDPWSTSPVRCAVMARSSPAYLPPPRSTPGPHQNP